MADLDKVDGLDSFEEVKATFRPALYAAAARKDLPGLAEFCERTFATTTNGFVRPYAFAYAARALLHHRGSYDVTPERSLILGSAARERIERLLRAPGAVNDRDNYYYDIVAGIRSYVLGDVHSACWNFAKAARFGDFFRVVRDDFGGGASFGRSFPSQGNLEVPRDELKPSNWHEADLPPGGRQLVLSSHADSLYAEAFFPAWIEQLSALHRSGLLLHLHVIFRHERQDALLDRFRSLAAAGGLTLHLSSEAGQPRDKAYFAASRFLRARHFLERFGCNTVFMDADAYIVDIPKFAGTHLDRLIGEDAITGMIAPVFAEGYLPWRRFSAGWILIPYNARGLEFARLLHGAHNYFWDSRFGRNWWIDQFCLEAARIIMLRADPSNAPFRSWPATFPDSIAAVGDQNKKKRVALTSPVQNLMNNGLSYNQAMARIHRGDSTGT